MQHENEKLPRPGSDTPVKKKPFKLGILIVHGIGLQPAGEILIKWGDILLNTIRRATGDRVRGIIQRGELGGKTGDHPSEIEVKMQWNEGREATDETWVIAEGWWADSFPAPTYKELLSWSFRAVPWAIATHVAQRYRQKKSPGNSWNNFKGFIQLLFALLLAPLIILLLAIIILLGVIPQLRKTLLSIQSALTGTVGDSLVFAESPVRAAFIKTRIQEGLEQLKKKCDHTIILAHSQGAAVVMDTLGGISDTESDRSEIIVTATDSKEDKAVLADAVDKKITLVTFGSGINKLASLKQLARERVMNRLAFDPPRAAVISILATIAFFWILLYQVSINVVSPRTMIFTIIFILAGILLGYMAPKVIQWYQKKPSYAKKSEKRKSKELTVGVVVIILAIAVLITYGNTIHLFSYSLFALILACIFLVGMLSTILTDQSKFNTGKIVKPGNVVRWVDIYSSDDPVPNGSTLVDDEKSVEPIEIWNYGSTFADHTSYWNNHDGFVLRIAKVCAQAAGSKWKDMLPAENQYFDKRAKWRVRLLKLITGINFLAWIAGLFIFWFPAGRHIPLLFNVPSFIPEALVPFLLFMQFSLIIVIMIWLTSKIIFIPWIIWVRREQKMVLDGKEEQLEAELPSVPLFFMRLFVCCLLVAEGRVLIYGSLNIDLSSNDLFRFGLLILGACFVLWNISKRRIRMPKMDEEILIRYEALQRYKKEHGHTYMSRYCQLKELVPIKNIWLSQIPVNIIDNINIHYVNILCQVAPGKNDFHHLKVATTVLKEHLKKFQIRNGHVNLYLSADPGTQFTEVCGKESLDFKNFLHPKEVLKPPPARV